MTVEELRRKHPDLLTNVECGVYIGDGWAPLVHVLCSYIEAYCRIKKIGLPIVTQVKQKFCGLRFYIEGTKDERILGMIEMAEGFSYYLCESCGAPSPDPGMKAGMQLCLACKERLKR